MSDDRYNSEDCDTALVMSKGKVTSDITYLYDSGAMRHMMPYKHLLKEYCSIFPKPINATNQYKFQAIGKGNMLVLIQNGSEFTPVMLMDVLHTPDITMTLVSVS